MLNIGLIDAFKTVSGLLEPHISAVCWYYRHLVETLLILLYKISTHDLSTDSRLFLFSLLEMESTVVENTSTLRLIDRSRHCIDDIVLSYVNFVQAIVSFAHLTL